MKTLSPKPAHMAMTPMAYARTMVEALKRSGVDASEALQAAQITPSQLQTADARITAAQMETLSARCMQRLDDEALGWFERRLPWGSYGMLARASLSAPDLRVALKRWCRHHGLLTGAVALQLHDDGELATLSLDAPGLAPEVLEFAVVTLLRNVLGFASWVIDSRIALRAAAFAFAAPPHADAYAVLFPCPVRFEADAHRLHFDARYLRLAPCRSEDDARTMLQRALPLTVHHYRRDRLLVSQVRQLLQQQPETLRDAASIAHALAMSERSLHRQLHAEGSSLQSLKDQVRRQLACELLQRSSKPLKQIADAVGFRNEKSFIRAFRQWTGVTPQAWRTQTC